MRALQLAPLLLLLSALSCRSVQKAQDPHQPSPPETTVRVRNQKPVDFTVYVLNGTHRIRLGTVSGMSESVFTIPAHLVIERGMLRFHLDPIGSEDVLATDEDLVVHEGDQVSLTIS